MISFRVLACLISALIAALFALPAVADEAAQQPQSQQQQPVTCEIKRVLSLDAETMPTGEIAIPVTLNDTPGMFEVDTGSIYSSISQEAAAELGLQPRFTPFAGEFMNGVSTDSFTVLQSFSLGPIRSHGKWPMIISPNQILPTTISGLLGPDVMRGYDVEFDFYRGKFNLFLHNTCPGAVYWTKDTSAAIPMKLDSVGHVVVDAQLDGKPVTILLDTGSPTSVMSLEAAQDLFDWPRNDPRLKYLRMVSVNGGASAPFYSFPFTSLTFDAVTVKNPKIQLMPKDNFDPHGRSDAQIVLGMSVLRQLHLYFAYEEKKLYLSGAEAK